MSDPTAATLRTLAEHYRNLHHVLQGTELEPTVRPGAALADLFDGIANHYGHESDTCVLYIAEDAVAVAAALGIEAT